MQYDIIGDIHGHADQLEQLLQKLGYKLIQGVYGHPEGRKVLFLGDYIDRGPKIRETLFIVYNMVQAGNALAIMGNHEYNAVCFHTPHTEDGKGFFRKHTILEIEQHLQTLRQFKNFKEDWRMFLNWFRELPMFIDLPECRLVHAYWKDEHIHWLQENYKGLSIEFLEQSTQKGSLANKIVDETLKGVEWDLPNGAYFLDKDGNSRDSCRLKWWSNNANTYGDFMMGCPSQLKDITIEEDSLKMISYTGDRPVFFGHYWLKGTPVIENDLCICLDYSVAKEGHLVAARLVNSKQEIDLYWV